MFLQFFISGSVAMLCASGICFSMNYCPIFGKGPNFATGTVTCGVELLKLNGSHHYLRSWSLE